MAKSPKEHQPPKIELSAEDATRGAHALEIAIQAQGRQDLLASHCLAWLRQWASDHAPKPAAVASEASPPSE